MGEASSVIMAFGLIAVLYFVYYVVGLLQQRRKYHAALKQWPGLPTHWLYGNIHQHPMFDSKIRSEGGEAGLKFHRDLTAKHPKGFYFFLGPSGGVITANHPDIMRPIMKNGDPKPLQQGQPSYRFALPWLGESLLLAKGDKWLRNRRLLTPAFHFDILKSYIGVFNEAVDVLLVCEGWCPFVNVAARDAVGLYHCHLPKRGWIGHACENTVKSKMDQMAETGEYFEVTKNVSLCTLDILLRCVFSKEMNCQTNGNHPYVEAVHELTADTIERCFHYWMYFDVLFNMSSLGRKFHKNCAFVHRFSDDIISDRRAEIEKNGLKENGTASGRRYLDFLDILLSARDTDGEGLTDLEVRNEVDTFLFEGHDTTSSSLTWVLYLLAKHPEHQKKVQEEIDDVLEGRDSDIIEWDDLGKFKYLVQCLKESMRLYPPVPFIQRVIQKEVEIEGKILPAGTTLDVAVYNLHHNPEIWPDHMDFIPDRFSQENVQKMDPFSYIPFAAGPRNCIGQNFAMNEEKVLLARLLRRFHLDLHPDHPVVVSNHIVMKAHYDVKIKLTRRL